MVKALRELQGDADACYGFMFPDTGIVGHARLSSATEREMLAAMVTVVRAARESAYPSPSSVDRELEPVIRGLVAKHGSDVEVLDAITSPTVDRGKACRMSLALYEELLEHGEGRAVRALFMRAASPA